MMNNALPVRLGCLNLVLHEPENFLLLPLKLYEIAYLILIRLIHEAILSFPE